MIKKIDPKKVSIPEFHRLMLAAVAPRPIAFASTIDKDGHPNLSPFSFFNAFGSNPPTLVFSPSRRGRDNTTKNTFDNLKEVPEVVINVVTYDMVEQMNLASAEYASDINEFEKAGFTSLSSEKVLPLRVKESPVQFECKVKQIIETGELGGAGNLVICEILLAHFNENIMDENGNIHPDKLDLVGRLGGDYYVRTSGDANFKVSKPPSKPGIGVDKLPLKIRLSKILTGNDLGKLGNAPSLPDQQFIDSLMERNEIKKIIIPNKNNPEELETQLQKKAQNLIAENKIMEALGVLLI
ncbi:flavin reductase family protein [Bacteroidota bacterium]